MAYFMYSSSTGQLIEVSDDLIYDGSPPSGMAISYIDMTKAQVEADYVWDPESRDFFPRAP